MNKQQLQRCIDNNIPLVYKDKDNDTSFTEVNKDHTVKDCYHYEIVTHCPVEFDNLKEEQKRGKDIEFYNEDSYGWAYVLNPSFAAKTRYRVKQEIKKNVFKKGDKLFYGEKGWVEVILPGVVSSTITVNGELGVIRVKNSLLSFTEYKVSHDRNDIVETFERGELVWVKNQLDWTLKRYYKYSGILNKHVCYGYQTGTSKHTANWIHIKKFEGVSPF